MAVELEEDPPEAEGWVLQTPGGLASPCFHPVGNWSWTQLSTGTLALLFFPHLE